VNPDGARAKARVFTPDVPRGRRYTPKALKLGVSDLDISVAAGSSGSMTVSLTSINSNFLVEDADWTPYVVVRNYSDSTSVTIDDAVDVADPTPTPSTVSSKALTSNVATITTAAAHGLFIGTSVIIAGVDATFNGTYTVTNVPSNTTFTYSKTAANVVSTVATGTVAANYDDRITVTLQYNDILKTIGKVDPGTYDIYASRTVGDTTETVYIGSGNLNVSLSTSVVTAYTLGS
jgi:tetrahydromethanopterin S-methyltransferase subunit B